MPVTAIVAPTSRPIAVSVPDASSSSYRLESWNVGSRNVCSQSVTSGICGIPPITASTASAPIAIFIGNSRSAMWCSGPGNPTSVSSISPVIGLVGCSAWNRWPCSSSCASGTGSPKNARKIIRNV